MRYSAATLILFLFFINVNGQTQIGPDIFGDANYDWLGRSVDISDDGTIIAVGAPYNDGNGLDCGIVKIYKNISGVWSQLGNSINGESSADQFGLSVSLNSDGTIVAIGAPYNNGNGGDSGHVRIYQYASGAWTKLGQDIDGEAAGDNLGISVSINSTGTIVAIGAWKNDGSNGTDSGHVRIYQYISGVWTKLGQDIDGEAEYDDFGRCVSINSDGTIVAIGAPWNNGDGSSRGHVRVLQNLAGVWTQIGNDINGEADNDLSGSSVSINGDGSIVAIGAYNNDGNGTNSGHVRIYQNLSGNWSQIGSDIDGEAPQDWSGYSISLNSTGNIVGIGANFNDGNGTNSGHVRVFKNLSDVWTQIGNDIDGEDESYFGYSVSLNSNGSVLVVGEPNYGLNRGAVRVYNTTASSIMENMSITNTTFGSSDFKCFDALQTITIAGDGNPVLMQNGSSVNLIAGGNIRFLPGFHAQTGSYMNAIITTNESFCSDLNQPIVVAEPVSYKSCDLEDELNSTERFEDSSIKIYPNPNNGHFTLEIINFFGPSQVKIINQQGKIVDNVMLKFSSNAKFDLSHLFNGLYYIQVSNGKKQFVQKFMKQ